MPPMRAARLTQTRAPREGVARRRPARPGRPRTNSHPVGHPARRLAHVVDHAHAMARGAAAARTTSLPMKPQPPVTTIMLESLSRRWTMSAECRALLWRRGKGQGSARGGVLWRAPRRRANAVASGRGRWSAALQQNARGARWGESRVPRVSRCKPRRRRFRGALHAGREPGGVGCNARAPHRSMGRRCGCPSWSVGAGSRAWWPCWRSARPRAGRSRDAHRRHHRGRRHAARRPPRRATATARPDAVPRPSSPRAARVSRNAYAPSSWTMPSVASLFTSRYPRSTASATSTRGCRTTRSPSPSACGGAASPRPASPPTGVSPPSSATRRASRRWRGFFDSPGSEKKARGELIRADAPWSGSTPARRRRGEPRLLYLQYMEPHAPLRAAEP